MKNKCIYCLKDDDEVIFNGRDHIIPQFLFDGLERLPKGLVCDACNSYLGKLEQNFKHSTPEGLLCQMLNYRNSSSIHINYEKMNMKFLRNFDEELFNGMFPFLDKQGKVQQRSHIIITNSDNSSDVYEVDRLKQIFDIRNSSKSKLKTFDKIKNHILNSSPKQTKIFAYGERGNLENIYKDIVDLLKLYGMDYKTNEIFESNLNIQQEQGLRQEGKITVDRDIAKVVAKICFNYFAYCCFKEKSRDVLYSKNFDNVRKIIYGEDVNRKDYVKPNGNRILYDEIRNNKGYIAHQVLFLLENEEVIGKLIILGSPLVYEIKLGKFDIDFTDDEKYNFGCGHYFCPISRTVINLVKNPNNQTNKIIKPEYGLFKSNISVSGTK